MLGMARTLPKGAAPALAILVIHGTHCISWFCFYSDAGQILKHNKLVASSLVHRQCIMLFLPPIPIVHHAQSPIRTLLYGWIKRIET